MDSVWTQTKFCSHLSGSLCLHNEKLILYLLLGRSVFDIIKILVVSDLKIGKKRIKLNFR